MPSTEASATAVIAVTATCTPRCSPEDAATLRHVAEDVDRRHLPAGVEVAHNRDRLFERRAREVRAGQAHGGEVVVEMEARAAGYLRD